MGARTDTKQRMVAAAASLLSTRGVAGTTVARVLAESRGPRGSVQFHFPGGRTELLSNALTAVGDTVTAMLRAAADAGTSPTEVLTAICQHYKRQLRSTGFEATCPVWAVVQEAHDDPELGPLATSIIDDWTSSLVTIFTTAGHSRKSARDLASLSICSVEGAITMARIQRSDRPLDLVMAQLQPVLNATR